MSNHVSEPNTAKSSPVLHAPIIPTIHHGRSPHKSSAEEEKLQLAKFEIHSPDGDPTLTWSRRMTFPSKAIDRDEDNREHLTNTVTPRNHTAKGSSPEDNHIPHETEDNEVYLPQSTRPFAIELLAGCRGGSQRAYCLLLQARRSVSPSLFDRHYALDLMFILSFCTHRGSSHHLIPPGSVRPPTPQHNQIRPPCDPPPGLSHQLPKCLLRLTTKLVGYRRTAKFTRNT
jgi:hypothetical protein